MVATDPRSDSRSDVMRYMLPALIEPLDGGHIAVNRIVPSPHQPRKLSEHPFDPEHDEEDAELVQSVREHGVIEPIGVIVLQDGTYQLLWGERRWRASMAAGRETIPAIIRNTDRPVTEEERRVFALIENMQRKDLAPDEICDGIEELRQVTGYDWERIARMLGKSERTLRRYRRLNDLTPEVRKATIEANLSTAQINALASAPAETQAEMLQQIVDLRLPGTASREVVQAIAQDVTTPVAVAARKAAGGHLPKASRGERPKVWTMSPMHTRIVESLLMPGGGSPPSDDAPSPRKAASERSSSATKRVKALLEQIEAMKLDLVDTRNAALLMSFDPNLPSPSAVAMAQSVRATRIGKALASIEAGLDMIEGSSSPSAGPLGAGLNLSGNEEHAVMAILAHLQERIKGLSNRKKARKNK